MLADNGIIFPLHHFFGEITRIFAGYIEKSGVRRADEFDLYIGWFRHGAFLKAEAEIKTATRLGAALIAALMVKMPKNVKKKPAQLYRRNILSNLPLLNHVFAWSH